MKLVPTTTSTTISAKKKIISQKEKIKALCKKGDAEKNLCQRMSKNGFCKTERTYKSIKIVEYCPDSCGLCDSYKKKKFGDCKDENPNCRIWAEIGFCKKIEEQMEDMCRQSCGLCE